MAAGTLTADPEEVDFGSLQFGGTQSRTVEIANAGPDAVVLSDIVMFGDVDPFEFAGGSCELEVALPAGESCDLELTFSPTRFEQAVHEVELIVAGGTDELATATLTAATLAFVPLALTPRALDFSLIPAGSASPPQWVGIQNLTSATVSLDAPVVTGPFWVSGWTCGGRLGPQAACGASVHMRPPAGTPAGGHSGRLTFRAEGQSFDVALSGSVVAAATPPPTTPPTRRWPVARRLGKLVRAVPAAVRGGPSRSRALPPFEAGEPGRLRVALLAERRGREVRIGGGAIAVAAAGRARLALRLNERGVALLRRPRRTRVAVVAEFEPRTGKLTRQRAELVVKAPAVKRKRR